MIIMIVVVVVVVVDFGGKYEMWEDGEWLVVCCYCCQAFLCSKLLEMVIWATEVGGSGRTIKCAKLLVWLPCFLSLPLN